MTDTTPPEDRMQALARALQQFADARDWGPFHSPKNLASALIVEAGELLEHFQWLTEDQSRQLAPDTRQAVAHEMADVLLYLVQLSTVLDIDLMDAARGAFRHFRHDPGGQLSDQPAAHHRSHLLRQPGDRRVRAGRRRRPPHGARRRRRTHGRPARRRRGLSE